MQISATGFISENWLLWCHERPFPKSELNLRSAWLASLPYFPHHLGHCMKTINIPHHLVHSMKTLNEIVRFSHTFPFVPVHHFHILLFHRSPICFGFLHYVVRTKRIISCKVPIMFTSYNFLGFFTFVSVSCVERMVINLMYLYLAYLFHLIDCIIKLECIIIIVVLKLKFDSVRQLIITPVFHCSHSL